MWRATRSATCCVSRWRRAGVLGGIAKGFTAEQLVVDFLGQWGSCLVDAGGDLTAGDGPAGHPGWPVAIAMPDTDENVEPATAALLWLNNEQYVIVRGTQ